MVVLLSDRTVLPISNEMNRLGAKSLLPRIVSYMSQGQMEGEVQRSARLS